MPVHDAVEAEIVKPLGLDGMSIGAPPDRRDRVARAHRELRRRRTGRTVRRREPRACSGCARRSRRSWCRSRTASTRRPTSSTGRSPRSTAASPRVRSRVCTPRSRAAVCSTASGSSRPRRSGARPRSSGPGSTSSSASRCGGGSATTSPRLRSGIIPNGFGHFGFGGSGAWADPDNDLAVAFVCNRVAGTPFGDMRFLQIGAQARAAALARADDDDAAEPEADPSTRARCSRSGRALDGDREAEAVDRAAARRPEAVHGVGRDVHEVAGPDRALLAGHDHDPPAPTSRSRTRGSGARAGTPRCPGPPRTR